MHVYNQWTSWPNTAPQFLPFRARRQTQELSRVNCLMENRRETATNRSLSAIT